MFLACVAHCAPRRVQNGPTSWNRASKLVLADIKLCELLHSDCMICQRLFDAILHNAQFDIYKHCNLSTISESLLMRGRHSILACHKLRTQMDCAVPSRGWSCSSSCLIPLSNRQSEGNGMEEQESKNKRVCLREEGHPQGHHVNAIVMVSFGSLKTLWDNESTSFH